MANTQVATTKKTGIATFLTTPKAMEQIESLVGREKSKTFISSIVSAVQTNPQLAECTNTSILSGALLGESLGLSPSPQLGNYYLVGYRDTKKGITEAQFQIGYKGMLQLAIRSGSYKKIVASEIKEGEITGYNPITEEFVISPILDFEEREKLPTVGYYAMFELSPQAGGFRKELFWTKEQMESHAKKYSKGYAKKSGYTFWEKDFDSMAKKTMLRQLISKWGIMSVEMQRAYTSDMGVIRENGEVDYVDNKPDSAEEVIAENENTVVADFKEVAEG